MCLSKCNDAYLGRALGYGLSEFFNRPYSSGHFWMQSPKDPGESEGSRSVADLQMMEDDTGSQTRCLINIKGTSSPTEMSKYRTRNCRRAIQKMHNINMLVANVHML